MWRQTGFTGREKQPLTRSETGSEGGFSVESGDISVCCTKTSGACDPESTRQAATRGHHELSLSKNMTCIQIQADVKQQQFLCLGYDRGQGSSGVGDITGLTEPV